MEERIAKSHLEPPQVSLRKCAVIGCGRVGATVAYTLMQTGWFSELVLLDIDTDKAARVAADLAHGLPFHTPMDIYCGDYADLSDCGLIILAAGAEEDGELSPSEAVRRNAKIFHSIVSNIVIYCRDAILLAVTDPVDILTHVAQRVSGFSRQRVLGVGTVLDTARLKQLVGSHLGVDSRNVHSFIIGEHGENEVAVWSSANVSGVDLPHYCESCGRGYDKTVLEALFHEAKECVPHRGSQNGNGCYAIAESVKRIVAAIVRDENTVLPVSAPTDGHYGLEEVYMSLPCIVNRSGIKQVLEIPLNEEEEDRLHRSARALRTTLEKLEPHFDFL